MPMNGTVKYFNENKGFGFISGEDGKEYFVHRTGIEDGKALREGSLVVFAVEEGDRGPKAVIVEDSIRPTPELVSYLQDIDISGFIGTDNKPVLPGSQEERIIVTDAKSVTTELLRSLDKNPELLHRLTSRKFEEVIAEILSRLGCQTTLTPASRDGGFDICAVKKDTLGSWLFLVECKKYAPNNHVGVGVIRDLHGVVQAKQATAGIIATTSFFTEPAKGFQRTIKFQMSLQNYFGIQRWIREALQEKTCGGEEIRVVEGE